ncbi:two-component system sensor histidine kinase NtrB [Rubripirellula reticaptiva]|uniref:histidine kinase n=1 Tax=Rubripirellula reticaptiva TaxID=2528013 RepID=A0A5C6EID2_9BACT|nr:ATP-binding protein [Rubripirellula reticaptiva]TWU47019.1 Sporulation kinase E [Rubripirellula reticaptiva]
MFRNQTTEIGKNYRVAVIGLSLLSAAALAITLWMLTDLTKEQSVVDSLMKELPTGERGPAEYLAGELKWQFRLTILVVINVTVAGIAVILLWRAYHASQASLRDFKALASDVISGMDLGVITTDLAGYVTSINQRGIELLELDSDCVGDSIAGFKTVALNEFRDDWMAERSTEMFRDLSVEIDGGTRRLRTFCQTLNDHEGNEVGNVIQLRDVTERFLIEQRMRRMERYMGLGSLAGGLHHEIKNPLAALSLHVQLLEEQLESDGTSDENRQMLGVIRTEVTRIGGVLESFRDFAAIDSLHSIRVDIAEMLKQQVELMRLQTHQQNILVVLNTGEGETTLEADQTRLEQVFLNLFINATEAMPEGGQLTISIDHIDESLRINFADTGNGIPASLADKILDPYFTTKDHGTGLGLALCDKIVRQHQGTLDFYSSANGTTFEVTLPFESQANVSSGDLLDQAESPMDFQTLPTRSPDAQLGVIQAH